MSRPFLPHVITDDSALGGSLIERSLRFNHSDNAYIERTCSSEGNRVKWTWSGWVRRVRLGSTTYGLLSSDNGGDGGGNNGIASIYFGSDDKLHVYYDTTSGDNYGAINDAVYRDINSWYHIVWQVDAANSTSKIWVNGVEQSIASGKQPISGYNYTMNQSGKRMNIGIDAWDLATPASIYVAETHYSDGQLYAATDFGYRESQTGLWRPKNGNVIKSNITYGTNGFWLSFRDNTNTTTLGYDYSGNGNNWSVNNITTGADLVTNGEFNSDSDWTKDSSWTISGGKASNSGGGEIYQTVALVSGRTYIMKATVDATGDSSLGNTSIGFRDTGDTQFYAYQATFANGSFTDLTANAVNEVVIPWTSTVTGNVRFRCYSSDTITIDNWSVIELADSVEDTPTNNFPVMNPLQRGEDNPTVADGNLYFGGPTDHAIVATVPIPSSGKWYWEYTKTADTNLMSGIIGDPESMNFSQLGTYVGGQSGGYSVYAQNGQTYAAGSNATYMATPPTRTTIMIAYDADTRRLYFGADGHWGDGSGNTDETFANAAVAHTVAAGKTYYPAGGFNGGSAFANFGQQRFSFTPPTGYKALSSRNLPPNVPSIIRPQKLFDTVLWTGNGGTSQTVTGLEFKPDFVWIKGRSNSAWHRLQNSVVGANKLLYTNSTNAEATNEVNGYVSEFTNDGFKLADPDSNGGGVNQNGETYVAWCWKAGGAAVSNSDGTITSSVSANTEAGFSIVSYTGNETNNATVGHGLGKSPDWVIIKDRDTNSAGNNWYVFHSALASGHYVKLNQTSATTAVSGTSNGGVGSVTSTTFNFVQGTTGNNKNVNESGDNFIAYCWTSIPGFSKFGSYIGNGSTNGTYIHLGFRPAWLVMKRVDGTSNWEIVDIKRDTFNFVNEDLSANNNNAENAVDGTQVDFLSNGFKHYDADSTGTKNVSGGTYIYMAFAEQPGITPFATFPNAR